MEPSLSTLPGSVPSEHFIHPLDFQRRGLASVRFAHEDRLRSDGASVFEGARAYAGKQDIASLTCLIPENEMRIQAAIKYVTNYPERLGTLCLDLIDTQRVVVAAVMQSGDCITGASERLRENADLVWSAIENSWWKRGWALKCDSAC